VAFGGVSTHIGQYEVARLSRLPYPPRQLRLLAFEITHLRRFFEISFRLRCVSCCVLDVGELVSSELVDR
jgi:hypothetical protein